MTAISPLEYIHKKGIFGDHHKKNESDLLQISEVKDLNIFQVVFYKKSENKIDNIKIDNLNFPTTNSIIVSNKETKILWSAPRTWLVISSKNNIADIIKKDCGDKNFAITDITHSRAIIKIKGSLAKEVLKKGCPINFNKFNLNNNVASVYNGISIIIAFVENNPDAFYILTLRSFGESFYHHLTDASLEYGYVGV